MALALLRDTARGVRRLLEQPADLAPRHPAPFGIPRDDASPEHRSLHADYQADLTTALGIATLWWEDTVVAREGPGVDPAAALRDAFDDRWAGPAAHPKVVWIVRLYWLTCDAINREIATDRPVHPATFLLQWLVDAGEDDLVALLACMPYWPVGLDADGNWC